MRKITPPTGRRCYDHLGGRLGALLLELYLREGWLEPAGEREYRLTDAGRARLEALGVPPETLDGIVKSPKTGG